MRHISESITESIIGRKGSSRYPKIDLHNEKSLLEWTSRDRSFAFVFNGRVENRLLTIFHISDPNKSEIAGRFKEYPVIYIQPWMFANSEISKKGFMLVIGAKSETGPGSHDLKIEIYDSDHDAIIYSDITKDHKTQYIDLWDICSRAVS